MAFHKLAEYAGSGRAFQDKIDRYRRGEDVDIRNVAGYSVVVDLDAIYVYLYPTSVLPLFDLCSISVPISIHTSVLPLFYFYY